jgi:ADP-glucose pyrophosphorylase
LLLIDGSSSPADSPPPPLFVLLSTPQTLKLTLWEKDNPIYTEPRTLPPAKVLGSSNPGDADSTLVTQSLVGDGCRIGPGCKVAGCVLGSRTFVSEGCSLKVGIRTTLGNR